MTSYTSGNKEFKIITINIPRKLDDFLLKLKKWGLIPSRSEVLRHACIKYCIELKNLMETIEVESEELELERYVRIPRGDGTYDYKEIIKRLE